MAKMKGTHLFEDGVNIGDGSTSIVLDGSDLKFTDASGTATLTTLKSMRNIWISASSQAPGNLTLSDGTNWAAQYSFIDTIHVKTSSTDWSLWLCEANSFTKTLITTSTLIENASGDQEILVARSYNSDGNNVYIIYQDDSGTNNADIYIKGEARRH